MELTEELLALLRQPSTCYIATLMKDGSPQITQTWVDTDGEHVIINSVQGYVKLKNIKRDPRVAVVISAPDNPTRYFQMRGQRHQGHHGRRSGAHREAFAEIYRQAVLLVRRARAGAHDHHHRA